MEHEGRTGRIALSCSGLVVVCRALFAVCRVWLFMSESGSHNHVDDKDKAKGDGHILMDLGHNGCVGEDPQKNLGNYECHNSQDVEGAAALVGVADILNQGHPAKDKTCDRQKGTKVEVVAHAVCVR